jgi:hypothetical protein
VIIGSWKTATIPKYVADPPEPGTLSAEVDLGRAYETLLVVIPTIDSAVVNILGAEKTAGTFQNVCVTDQADGSNSKVITTPAGTGAFTWVVPIGGVQYIKVQTSNAQTTAARNFRVCGVRR